jgi:hypothetical protein
MAFFLGLITRCKDEYFIQEFCDYYLSQGVEHIYIIDDNSCDKSIYNKLIHQKNKYASSVFIIYKGGMFETTAQMKEVNILYSEIKHKYKWMISVDVDEFITTKKNMTKTIREELETTFKDIDCIKIPWVLMACNRLEKSPNSILKYLTYRWNHDLKHPHHIKKFECRYNKIQVKCIFKTKAFNAIDIHHPCNETHNDNSHAIIVCGIRNHKKRLTPFYQQLREKEIRDGYLLCYHYRIISVENCINKLKTNTRYIKMKYTLNDLLTFDHPEIKDETLKNKSLAISNV